MGQFESGKWIVAISLYFFVLFLCVYCIVKASAEEGFDKGTVYFNDPGFQSIHNDPTEVNGACGGWNFPFCSNTYAGNESCALIPGCTWLSNNITNTYTCIGTHNIACSDIENDPAVIPAAFTKQEFCQLLQCTYTDAMGNAELNTMVDPLKPMSMGAFTQTIGLVTGVGYNSANLGMPAMWAFVGQFLIFWIPFFMLLWAIYMALPFVH